MLGFILLIIALAGLTLWFRYQTAERRKVLKWKIFLSLIILTLGYLALTGRLHWLGVVIAAILPIIGKLIPWLLRSLPFLSRMYSQRQSSKTSTKKTTITKQQAYELLGLEAGADTASIKAAHKKLMQKVHPDQGGNDYLAAQINQARDVLLKS